MENTFTSIIIRSWLPSIASEADWVVASRWHGLVPVSTSHYHMYYVGESFPKGTLLPTFLQCHPVNLMHVPLFVNEPEGLLLFFRTNKTRKMLPLFGCHLACFGLQNAGYFYVVRSNHFGRIFIFTPPLRLLNAIPEVTIHPKIPSHVLYSVTHPPFGKGWQEHKVYDDYTVYYHSRTDVYVIHLRTPFFVEAIHELLEEGQSGDNKSGGGRFVIALGYSEEASLYFPESFDGNGARSINTPRGCAICGGKG